ncbi:MAG: hypothetical protein ABIX12_08500 [Rubrivivax sp.]
MIESYDTPSTATRIPGDAAKPTPPSIKPVADAIVQEASHLNESTQAWLANQSERYLATARHLQEEAAVFGRKTQDYMRAEPIKSAVIAAIAGAVIAKLLSRPRDDR